MYQAGHIPAAAGWHRSRRRSAAVARCRTALQGSTGCRRTSSGLRAQPRSPRRGPGMDGARWVPEVSLGLPRRRHSLGASPHTWHLTSRHLEQFSHCTHCRGFWAVSTPSSSSSCHCCSLPSGCRSTSSSCWEVPARPPCTRGSGLLPWRGAPGGPPGAPLPCSCLDRVLRSASPSDGTSAGLLPASDRPMSAGAPPNGLDIQLVIQRLPLLPVLHGAAVN